MSRVDMAIRVSAGVTVIGLAGIAGAISYSHMAELAHAHGETGWRAHMFPLSVDGIEIVSSLVLLADKRAVRPSSWLVWLALLAGTAASLAANVMVGGADWIGRAVSGWPAFAMLVAVKLLAGLLDHPGTVLGGSGSSGTVPDGTTGPACGPGTVPGPGREGGDSVDDLVATSAASSPKEAPLNAVTELVAPVDVVSADIVALMPAARSARRTVLASGKTLTRERLANQLRTDGYALSNARVSAILRLLAEDPE